MRHEVVRSGSHALTRRVATAAVGLPLILAAVWAGSAWVVALLAAVSAASAWELAAMAGRRGAGPPAFLAAPWSAGIVVAAGALASGAPAAITVLPAFVGGAALSLAVCLVRARSALAARAWIVSLGIALYAGGLLSLGALLRSTEQGLQWVLFALLVTFAADTGAYAVGRAFGKRRMAPAISPSKTWEGAAAGLLSAVAAGVALASLLSLAAAAWQAGVLGAACGAAGQIGDLAASRVKRWAGVKDSGWLVPGHGGVLDRVDSLAVNVAMVYYSVLWWLR